jgi:putative phosphonate metabolism protein
VQVIFVSRYALYYAPRPDEDLAAFARAWLGRDPEADVAVPQPIVAGVAPLQLATLTAEPRRYGFHGTLKPPFALASGVTVEALLAFAADFARRQATLTIDAVDLALLDGFIALVPRLAPPALDALAAECVRAFDAFRAAPDETELARRRSNGLSARQDALLVRWGYPYVMEEFRFHLTLTGRLSEAERTGVWSALSQMTEPLRRLPVPVRDLVVFAQDDREHPFRVLSRFRFGTT